MTLRRHNISVPNNRHPWFSLQEEPFHRGSGANGPMRYVRTHPNSTPQIDDTDFFAKVRIYYLFIDNMLCNYNICYALNVTDSIDVDVDTAGLFF